MPTLVSLLQGSCTSSDAKPSAERAGAMHGEGARGRRAEGFLRAREGALHCSRDGDAVKIVPQMRKRIVEQQQ